MDQHGQISAICPACGGALEIVLLECPTCHLKIEGRFATCKYCQLSSEERQFLDLFIKSRGNISMMEKVLGLSYPTIRSRLEKLAKRLGLSDRAVRVKAEARKEIVERVKEGELSVEEAVELLEKL